ncbi:hypothetical protein [Campylobacter sp. RM16190]|uniref:tetratricopeptide repeat protein n=1 Tax=Campylobacter sp. RM16190 TaxID=1705727 RepID=UPI0014731926|nr:hypothetical protein [Campylobacter sp. RM16190]
MLSADKYFNNKVRQSINFDDSTNDCDLVPKFEKIKLANSLSKANKCLDAIKIFESLDQSSFNDIESEAFGWAIYRYISNEKNIKINTFKYFLYKYLKLKNNRPSILHSVILNACIKFENNNPGSIDFVKFLELWNVNFFQNDDYIAKEFKSNDGKIIQYPSLVSRALRIAIDNFIKKEYKNYNISWLVKFCSHAFNIMSYDQWFGRDFAQLSHKIGDTKKSIEIYKNLHDKISKTSYYWSEFGDFVKQADIDLAISMYSKALMQKNEDIYVIKIRLKLAELLIQKGLYENSKYELERYKNTKNKNLDSNFYKLYDLVKNAQSTKSNYEFYKSTQDRLSNFLYSDIKVVECLFYNKYLDNNTKKEYYCFTNFSDKDFKINKKQLKIVKETDLLSCFEFKFINDKPVISEIKKSGKSIGDFKVESPFKIIIGSLKLSYKIDGKIVQYRNINYTSDLNPAFGFLGKDFYIQGKDLMNFSIDKESNIKVIYRYNPKNQKNKIYFIKKLS